MNSLKDICPKCGRQIVGGYYAMQTHLRNQHDVQDTSGHHRGGGHGKWLRVSKKSPCPICQRPDWCTVSADGKAVGCMRVKSDKKMGGRNEAYLHILSEAVDVRNYIAPSKPKKSNVNWDDKAKECFDSKQAPASRDRLAQTLNVNKIALEDLMVGWGWDEHRDVDFTTWPEFDARHRVVGITRRYWSAVRMPDDSMKDKLMMPGGSHGIIFPPRYQRAIGNVTFVPEGGSDTAMLLSMGLICVGRPSNVGGIKYLIQVLPRFDQAVCVLGEWDEAMEKRGELDACPLNCPGCRHCFPGMVGARDTAKDLKGRINQQVFWGMLSGAKDVRLWVDTFGKDGEEFISQAREAVQAQQQ